MTPMSEVYAALAGLTATLLMLSTVMHVKRGNLPLSNLAIGLFMLNCFNFINVLIWNKPDSSLWWNGHGLCDVEVKLYLGIGQSIIGITASMFRTLANILDTNGAAAIRNPGRKMTQLSFDICMIYVLPTVVMSLHYLVQPNRFAISQFTGCKVTWDPSWPAVVLLWIWYPLACGICLYYTFLTMFRLHQHHRQVTTIIRSSNSSLTKSYFLRLLGLSTIFVFFFTPSAAYFFIFNVRGGLNSGYSWNAIHPANWSAQTIKDIESTGIAIDRWAQVIAGLLVFAVFGTGKEAIAIYIQLCPNLLLRGVRESRHWLLGRPRSNQRLRSNDTSAPNEHEQGSHELTTFHPRLGSLEKASSLTLG